MVGVEINQSLVLAARANAELNNVASCVEIAQGDSSEFCTRLLRNKKYTSRVRRDESSAGQSTPSFVTYQFSAVLVDPPRCGLDLNTLTLAAGYDHIVYISCSPTSLMRDLSQVIALLLISCNPSHT